MLPAKCFTSTTSFGWHHLTSMSRDDLNAAHDVARRAEVGSGTDDGRITVAPIISIAGEDTGFSSLDQHLGAIAIVFDFVNPVLPLWWLIHQGGKLGLDEPESCRYAKHWGFAGGSTGNG